MLAARAPKLAALGGGIASRLLGLVDLPLPLSDPGPRLAKFRPGDAEVDVVIVPDVFTAALDRPTLRAAASVLAHLGYRVAMSNFTSSGKFDHVKGNRKRFAQAVGKQSELVESIVSSGATPVVIEPAIALLHQHEYASVDAAYPSESVKSLVEMIIERMDLLPSVGGGHVVRLLGHCTERATSPATANGWVRVLESAGFVVDIPDIGCCGMAGIFGHEKANQKMSRDLWDLSWAQHVDAEVILTVTGYSCRSQAKRFSRANPRHPVTVLGEGLPSS